MNYAMLCLGYAVALNVMGGYIKTRRRLPGVIVIPHCLISTSGKGQCNALLYSQHPFQKARLQYVRASVKREWPTLLLRPICYS